MSELTFADGLAWLDSIAGSVHEEIDYKKEREEWRDEKYGQPANAVCEKLQS